MNIADTDGKDRAVADRRVSCTRARRAHWLYGLVIGLSPQTTDHPPRCSATPPPCIWLRHEPPEPFPAPFSRAPPGIAPPSAEFQSTCPAWLPRGNPPFQSTCPARGGLVQTKCRFNPRAPRGTTRRRRQPIRRNVSIHAPRAGHDPGDRLWVRERWSFNPRAPRGARPPPGCQRPDGAVSIHAPRAGRDVWTNAGILAFTVFQSTRPARGATAALRLSYGRLRLI